MRSFFSLVAFGSTASATLSCSGVDSYSQLTAYPKGSTVNHGGSLYAAINNIAANHLPGQTADWLLIQKCGASPSVVSPVLSAAHPVPIQNAGRSASVASPGKSSASAALNGVHPSGIRSGARSTAGDTNTTVPTVDCSDVKKWVKMMYQAGANVYHDSVHYYNEEYAGPSDVPPATPWKVKGNCVPGTEGLNMAVDCSNAYPYDINKIFDHNKHQWFVYVNNTEYSTNWYCNAGDAPGVSDCWGYVGECIPGTISTDGPAGPKVDCSTTAMWSGSATYPDKGMFAHWAGVQYVTNWWTSGDRPDKNDGQAWEATGACVKGTDFLGPPFNNLDMDEHKKELICHCCKKCAKSLVIGPQCMDDVATKDDCYFAWCPDYNNYDEANCTWVKQTQQLQYYTGEMTEGKKKWPTRVYVPYVDSGLAVQPPIDELATELGINHFVLAFIQAGKYDTTVGCQGGFASVIPIGVGPTSWNQTSQGNDYLYSRISKLRDLGGDVTVSFGGAMGTELADSDNCRNAADPVTAVKNAYKEAVDTLKLTHIDFDIEGQAVGSFNRATGWQIRFKAVKALSEEYPELHVWWTLPILPSGLTVDGVAFIEDLFVSGARWDMINVMTMDYGDATTCLNNDMHTCEISAIDALAKQVFDAATKAGRTSEFGWTSKDDVYPRLGSTPMIGLNDQTNELYSLQNAKDSFQVWTTSNRKLGIISNWSLTRDHPCPLDNVDCMCSSKNAQTTDYEFAKIFAPYTSE